MIFNTASESIVLIGVGGAVTATLSIFGILYAAAGTVQSTVRDDWRESTPRLVAILTRIFCCLTNGAGLGLIEKSLSDKESNRLESSLAESGHSYSLLPAEFVLLKGAGAIGSFLVCYSLANIYQIPSSTGLVFSLVLAGLGYVYPDIWLRKQIKQRKLILQKQFPFFLDVLVLTMRAGLALPSALQHATQITPDGPVKQEFSRLLSETRIGVSRSQALQRLAERVRVPSVSNFVSVVAQADESGGSLTVSLSEQAKQRRRERFQRAEKLAGQAPVKLLLPLFLFIFPILFMIIGIPILLDISQSDIF